MTGLPGAEPPDLTGLPPGTSVILCPIEGCDWKLVEPPRTNLTLADVAKVLSRADPTVLTIDEMVSSAVGNHLMAEARSSEQLLTEHFQSHDLLDFLRTIHALRTQLGDVVTEYGQIMLGDDGCGGYLVRNPSPRIEREYPVADWIADERQQGRFVARRRLVVVEDWIEVTEP